MKVIRTIAEWRSARSQMGRLGFVPTMGALHEGHLALVREACRGNDSGAISIFVNPLQFGANEDFAKYPRTEEADLELAAHAGARFAFCPDPAEMTEGVSTVVSVKGVGDRFEGISRPGHFDGVATIVARLFGIVSPDVAYFGLKDLQQCAVIRTMVADLAIPTELRFIETVREESGLALSSRNRYFDPKQRAEAAALHRTLQDIASQLRSGVQPILTYIESGKVRLAELGFDVQYLACVNPYTFDEVDQVSDDARLIVAAKFAGVRLIDNISVKDP